MAWTCLLPRSLYEQATLHLHHPRAPPQSTTLTPTAVTQPGTFNPVGTLPPTVVKRILDSKFIEMSEVSINDDTSQTPGLASAHLPVTKISRWLERYSLMAAILCTRFPHKAGELLAHQATIVGAERWVTYDRQFCREALVRKISTGPSLTHGSTVRPSQTRRNCPLCVLPPR